MAAVVGLLVTVLLAAVAVGLSRSGSESVTAWTSRGGATRDGVTSDVAVEDLSVIHWEARLPGDDFAGVGFMPQRIEESGDALVLIGEQIVVVDAETLELRWRRRLPRGPSASVGADGIITITRDEILTLDVADGSIASRTRLEEGLGPVAPAILHHEGLILLSTSDGVAAVDVADGTTRWSYAYPDGSGPPEVLEVVDDLVLVSSPGLVAGLGLSDGELRWRSELPAQDRWVRDWYRTTDGVVVTTTVATGDDHQLEQVLLTGNDVTDGRRLWQRELDGLSELAFAADGAVLVRPREPRGQTPAWVDARTGRPRTSPTVYDDLPPNVEGVVLAPGDLLVNRAGGLQRLRDGQVVWSAEQGVDWAPPGVAGERVFVPLEGGDLAILDLASGHELARLDLPLRWDGSLALVGDLVRASWNGAGLLHLGDGQPVERSREAPWLGHGEVTGPWGLIEQDVDSALVAVESTGEERWRLPPSSGDRGVVAVLEDLVLLYEAPLPTDPETRPQPHLVAVDAETGRQTDRETITLDPRSLVTDGTAIWGHSWSYRWGTDELELVRFDLGRNGRELEVAWRQPSTHGQLILAGNRLIDVGGATVVIRDAGDGTVTDTLELPAVAGLGAVVVADLVVTDDGDRSLHATDLGTGEPAWTHQAGGTITADPVAAGGMVYVATSAGQVEVIDATTGQLVTSRDVAPAGTSSAALVVARGVVLARFDGTVYAIGGPDGPRGLGPSRPDGSEPPRS